MRTPPCALPGIGLHLNTLATIPKDKIVPHVAQTSINQASNFPCAVSSSPPTSEPNTEDSSQAAVVANADEPSQAGPKKKRYDVYAHNYRSPASFNWKKSWKCNSTVQTQI
jgi:hypothetical protein